MREYRPWIAGVAAYLVVFGIVYAASKSLVFALALGAVFGVAAGLLTYSLFPSDPELLQYQLDARRRVRAVLKTTDEISDLANKVQAKTSREALLKGCQVIHDLLSLAQQKDPGNMASTAAKVGVYIASVKDAADAQVQIEAHPDYWADANQLLAANEQGFVNFRDFAISSVQHLNQGEVTELRANLNVLKPMTIPAMTT
jgi:hypothetical protein